MSLPLPSKSMFSVVDPTGEVRKYNLFTKADERSLLFAKESTDIRQRIEIVADIVKKCVVDFDPKKEPRWLTEWLYIVLRRDSIGPTIEFKVEEEGKDDDNVVIDLSEIKIIGDITKGIDTVYLNGCFDVPTKIKFHNPTIFDFAIKDENDDEQFIYNCLDEIYSGDETTSRGDISADEFKEWINGLPPKNFNMIVKEFERLAHVELNMLVNDKKTGLQDLLNFILFG